MADTAIIDRVVEYVMTGDEVTMYADWQVDTALDLVVTRTRAAVATVLTVDTDYVIYGLTEPGGVRIVLSPAAVAGDEYKIDGNEVATAADVVGLSYGLGQFYGDVWSLGRKLRRGEGVYRDGGSYVAIIGHVAASTNEPGTGAEWRLYWRQVAAKGIGTNEDDTVTYDKLNSSVVQQLADSAAPTGPYQRGWLDWIATPALTGTLAGDFSSGVIGRLDHANVLQVTLASGTLASATEDALLNGANQVAVQNAANGYEVLQFMTATLVGGTTYNLTGLLRGQGGTDDEMDDPVSSGTAVVFK